MLGFLDVFLDVVLDVFDLMRAEQDIQQNTKIGKFRHSWIAVYMPFYQSVR